MVERLRTGEPPVWLVDFDAEILPFVIACSLLAISFKLCELAGRWGDAADYLKPVVGINVVGSCLSIASVIAPLGVALQATGWFVVWAVIFDEGYQRRCEDGTDMWVGDMLPALWRGRFMEEWRKIDEERRRQRELRDEQEKVHEKDETRDGSSNHRPSEDVGAVKPAKLLERGVLKDGTTMRSWCWKGVRWFCMCIWHSTGHDPTCTVRSMCFPAILHPMHTPHVIPFSASEPPCSDPPMPASAFVPMHILTINSVCPS